MKIEEGKQYQTKAGLRWAAYSHYAGGDFPVHGAFQYSNGRWVVGAWSKDGVHCTCKEYDLMPVPQKFTRSRWVNVYPNSETIHSCKWSADNATKDFPEKRIALVEVKVEGAEGDNLEE